MYKIILKESVKEDWFYIADILFRFTFNKSYVDLLYKELIGQIFGLQIFPYRYVKYKDIFRVLIFKKKYKIFYKVDEEKKEVQVYRILFSRNNLEKIF